MNLPNGNVEPVSHALRPRSLVALAVTAAVSLPLAPGCGRPPTPEQTPTVAKKTATSAPRSVTTYKLVGVVRHVDSKAGSVTIRHEAIPGFMDAMTMPFTLKRREALEDVRPGDEVEGSLRVEKEGNEVRDFELTDLVVSRPAPPQALSLNLAGGRPEIATAAQPLQPGDLVPDFTMTGQDGKPLKLSDLRGKVVALTFIYTRCPLPDFCPRMDQKFRDLADRVAAVPRRAENVRLLSISFDPEHDTPDALTRHAETRGAKPPLWTFAVAPHDELAKVARPLGLVYGPGRGEIIHNLTIAVIDAEGRLVRLETGSAARSWESTDLLKTMYSRIPEARN